MEFVPSRRARRLNISIKNSRSIRVAVPWGVPLAVARKFFDNHLDWVRKSLQQVRAAEKNQQPVFDDAFRTRHHQLILRRHDSQYFLYQITHDKVIVTYPATADPKGEDIQKLILRAIIETYRLEARQFLPERVALLAGRFGFRYNRIFIKNLKSRWGSCSVKNNINLNLQLMRFENWIVDYIILHELLHTRIRNHGREFWNALAEIYPRFPEARRALKSVKPYFL